jgi:hypothetical protein
MTNLGGVVEMQYSYFKISGIRLPRTSPNANEITTFRADSNYYLGGMEPLDCSGLIKLGGTFNVSNSRFPSILFPDSSKYFSMIYFGGVPELLTVDMRGISGGVGNFLGINCASLHTVQFPTTSSSDWASFRMETCRTISTIDISSLTYLKGYFSVYDSSKLQNIYLPNFNRLVSPFLAQNCSLASTTIDDILGKYDTWFTSHTPTADISILLNGYQSDKPTTDGSTHIVNIKSIFTTAGRVADIRVN